MVNAKSEYFMAQSPTILAFSIFALFLPLTSHSGIASNSLAVEKCKEYNE